MNPEANDTMAEGQKWTSRLALVQGGYFLVTGLWPLISIKSFQAVTGRKKEPWLVKTVGLLITAVGVVLIRGRRENGRTLRDLGRLPAVALAGVDLWYAGLRDRISPVYLADAVVEVGLAVAWSVAGRSARR